MINQRSIVPLWVMAQIPTVWEIKGSESAIFGFPWFQPCHCSQNWWGVRTWTIKYHFDFCHRRVTKKIFMKICCRAAEIWVLENHEFWPFQSLISQLPYNRSSWKFFLGLSYDKSQNGILWFMSWLLTSFEKSNMAETMEIQKWHFHCPWSPKRLGFGPWPIKAQWISGLSLFTIPDLVDFHSEGAEILKVENHKREALL